MANEEHLAYLAQGVDVWNKWRTQNPQLRPDLSMADLRGQDLRRANLRGADLHAANLSLATDVVEGYSGESRRASSFMAYLGGADLCGADLRGANLCEANLRDVDLREASLRDADLSGADISNCIMRCTELANVDLRSVKGLETISHQGPSTIGIDTIYRSQGKIPEAFLRGAGVPENFITFMYSLVGTAFEFYSCFISYSSKDQDFATQLHADLQSKGVRCWFAPKDLPIGSETRTHIDAAIHSHDKLLVVLSGNSVKSSWVKKEVETAFEKENQESRIVLFPVRLDDEVMTTSTAWAADIRRMRNIGDFSDWRNSSSYWQAFDRLLRDLRAEDRSASTARSGT